MNLRVTGLIACNAFTLQTAWGANGFVSPDRKPNVVFVFADQLRAQALGYAGDPNVLTPHLDELAKESVNFKYAVSCMPVSTPYRACMLTGQYALTNGMFMNDIQLDPDAVSAGKIYKKNGYETAYVGKWHINGNGRSNYIEKEYRQGFDYFKALECTHNYNRSPYYDNDDRQKKYWNGYDVEEQTKDAISYMREHAGKERPFVLFLSWGTPHNPYFTAPEKYRKIYENKELVLRDNVSQSDRENAIKVLKGYYAHVTALDVCIGMLQDAISDLGIEDNTIFVFTSDHGDMLESHGLMAKQKPWDESIMVPFLLKYPSKLGSQGKTTDVILNTPDILPTLLGLSDIEIPSTVEGNDLSPILLGNKNDDTQAALIECITPYGEYCRRFGGREYRGIRTRQYTYVEDLNGPWLLYDNVSDPYQMNNLVNTPQYSKLQKDLKSILVDILKERGDEFREGEYYIKKWGYKVDKDGTVPYTN